MLQWLTGHGWWLRHLHVAGLSEESECRLCGEDEETPQHIYKCCPALTGQCTIVLHNAFPSYEAWSISRLVDFVLSDDIHCLVDLEQTLDVDAKV